MLDDNDGYLNIELAGRAEPVKLDVLIAHDSFLAAYRGCNADTPPAELYACTIKAAEELGFGVVSAHTAQKIENAVLSRMAELRKKDTPAETTP